MTSSVRSKLLGFSHFGSHVSDIAFRNYQLSVYLFRLIPKYLYKYVFFNSVENIWYSFNCSIFYVFFFLKNHLNTRCNYLIDICAVDFSSQSKRFQVVYHCASTSLRHRIRVKNWTDELSSVPSLVKVYRGANWYEREIWDLFGIYFSDHPDMRRLLTDYAFEGYPLRKDFPLSGYYELRYHQTPKRIVYQNVKLTQEYRYFDLLSPWEQVRMFKRSELYAPYSVRNKPLHIADLLPSQSPKLI